MVKERNAHIDYTSWFVSQCTHALKYMYCIVTVKLLCFKVNGKLWSKYKALAAVDRYRAIRYSV